MERAMNQESRVLFTDQEEEFVNLLIRVGTRKAVAQLLVFLAKKPKATSLEIERGTDLRQPEVSIAIKYLAGQGWIKSMDIPSEKKGRPMKNYSLAVPFRNIITAIEKAKKNDVNTKLALVGKMRTYI
jgi:predicted transcriptional regulator